MTDVATKPKTAPKRAAKTAGEAFFKVTLVRSLIGTPRDQRDTARALGLRKLHSQAVLKDTPAARGMVRKIVHALKVEEVEKP
jgi:large subunit ribosomal protein L30